MMGAYTPFLLLLLLLPILFVLLKQLYSLNNAPPSPLCSSSSSSLDEGDTNLGVETPWSLENTKCNIERITIKETELSRHLLEEEVDMDAHAGLLASLSGKP
jgi:hypothetical protein